MSVLCGVCTAIKLEGLDKFGVKCTLHDLPPNGHGGRETAASAQPPRESYLRCSVQANGWTMEPALEWRSGRDSFVDLVERLSAMCRAVAESSDRLAPPDAADAVGDRIAAAWPDRAYFVETWDDRLPGFGQCYQPYGCPRNR